MNILQANCNDKPYSKVSNCCLESFTEVLNRIDNPNDKPNHFTAMSTFWI